MSEFIRPPRADFAYLECASGHDAVRRKFSPSVGKKVMFAGGLWKEP